MRRNISKLLLNWKKEKDRKVVLLRGARQVGKTYSIRQLGADFEYFIEVNFEEEPTIHSLFRESLNPMIISENLSGYFGIPIIPGKTLLFFDEIQSCISAIQSLRFFYEKMPELHVIAAGSLLEFAIKELPTFGVGRIRSLFMYPLSFEEFLLANDEDQLCNLMWKANPQSPLSLPIHNKLIFYLKRFILVGGLPEVVQKYVDTKSLRDCQDMLDSILQTYYDDFAKYKKRVPVLRLRDVFNSIVFQSGGKFVLNTASDNANLLQIKDALELLLLAGIAYKINHTSANGIPLGAEINSKKFKVILFDTGLHQRILNLDIREQLVNNDFKTINKGNIAELFVGIELIKGFPPGVRSQIFYWHRESKSSNAEIDYLVQHGQDIIPLEVKAGTKGQMQSLFLFLKEKKKTRGIRLSLENFSIYPPIEVIPLYAASLVQSHPTAGV